jgi:hypothetical protein
MCFSAEASFTVSAALLIAGVASVKKVTHQSQIIFASIPLIFSFQQFLEGMLWLALKDPHYSSWQGIVTNIFLAFAQGIWPFCVPLAFLLLEKNEARKRILFVLLGMGVSLSLYLAYCLFYYEVNSEIRGHHIHYDILFPDYLKWLTRLFYLLPIVCSPFVSSVRRTWMLGVLNLASFFISLLFFHDSIISVWCFFAAVLSAVVLAVMWSMQNEIRYSMK